MRMMRACAVDVHVHACNYDFKVHEAIVERLRCLNRQAAGRTHSSPGSEDGDERKDCVQQQGWVRDEVALLPHEQRTLEEAGRGLRAPQHRRDADARA